MWLKKLVARDRARDVRAASRVVRPPPPFDDLMYFNFFFESVRPVKGPTRSLRTNGEIVRFKNATLIGTQSPLPEYPSRLPDAVQCDDLTKHE